ncbi:MAG: flagellar biosynthetic protein FliO [Butyrivibrio sp.]|nr:flagellar biosynthetic protein FliO [Butyrivibrio sp.]
MAYLLIVQNGQNLRSEFDSYLQFISVLIIFIVVLGATYYATKWMANYQKGADIGKNIEVVETCKISATKYVQIIRIGNRYVAIGVSKDQIVNLGDVLSDELMLNTGEKENMSFKDVLEKIKGEKKK